MVVIEIELLSGFEPTPISLKELKNNKQIKKVEYDEKTSTVALYFNDMPKEEICHQFQVKEVTMVEDRKPAIAKIYDYYDQDGNFIYNSTQVDSPVANYNSINMEPLSPMINHLYNVLHTEYEKKGRSQKQKKL